MWKRFAAIAVPVLLASSSSFSEDGDGAVGRASVIDGDTIEIHGERIRIHGVDAPEAGQTCYKADGTPWRCGQNAALALSDFLGQSTVSCERLDTDRYGRMVAKCRAHRKDVGRWLVSSGWAMAYTKYSADYVDDELTAKDAFAGIWQGMFQPPWEWRKEH